MVTVRFKNQASSALLAFNQSCTSEWVSIDDHDALMDGGIALSESEWSGTPRARCIDCSPMPLTAAEFGVAKTLLTPEGRASDVEAAHLSQCQPIWSGKMEANGMVIHHLTH